MLKRLFDWQPGSVYAVAVATVFGKRKAAGIEEPNGWIFLAGFVYFDVGVAV